MAKVRPQNWPDHEPKPCFRSTEKSRGRYRHFPHTRCPHRHSSHSPPTTTSISTSPPVGHLLELINLHWHVIIIQSPPLTWRLILGVVKSMGSDKCVTGPPLVCHSEWFCCPNNPLLSRSFLPPPRHWSFYCLHSFALFRVSYSWNHKVLICTHLFLRFLTHSLKRKIFIENVSLFNVP